MCAVLLLALVAAIARGEDVSAPAMLQFYEARWDTIEDRMVDLFYNGYGSLWLPPTGRADMGGFSVGYDVFDRFDLGKPRSETLYGTETALKATTAAAHRAGVSVYVDFVPNHNGFGNRNDPSFVALGGYPGFALTLPGDINGDFHDPAIDFGTDPLRGRLSGLVDINHQTNHQFIRTPVDPANSQNIPAGTAFNLPNASNSRFYTDQSQGSIVLNDPELSTMATRYRFNANTPLAGDPVPENAMGLLMRNAQWLVEVIGVDGFRLDASKHMPEWVLDHIDQAVFRANPRLNHDGSIQPVFMFSEILDGNRDTVDHFIRKSLPNPAAISPSDYTVAGNRDALDFPLFFAMRNNLTGENHNNNWHAIRSASQDVHDDGLNNGSAGATFVDSHDNLGGGFPYLKNVAYAYTLLRPGNALVYLNAEEFGTGRDFPNDGKVDALGGHYGETITTLTEIRNTHGRGDFRERWLDDAFNPNGFSNVYAYERSKSVLVGLNSRVGDGYDERNGVQTDFESETVLVELTGNANDATVDPGNNIPATIRVNGAGQVSLRIPRNSGHGRGYVIYGVPGPQGVLSLTNVAGTLAGESPSAANNGTARLGDIDVITADSFTLQLATNPVTLPAPLGENDPVRDFDADGDNALFRVDGGIDLNGDSGIDYTTPGTVSYGFEEFTDVRSPGYVSDGMGGNSGTGGGLYAQTIDASQLGEGRHFITARAFRHRSDGGPAVFTDFRQAIYVDRLPPEAAVVSFAPFASQPGNPDDRDLIVQSVDQTANNMHVFLDLPATMTDAQILQLAEQGQGVAGYYDRDQFVRGFSGVTSGNHAVTVVSYEPTGNHSVQRFTGRSTQTSIGAGIGDLDFNGAFEVSDLTANGRFEVLLYNQNDFFNPAADVNGDGLIDNHDLFGLDEALVIADAPATVLAAYDAMLLRRGDLNDDNQTDSDDLLAIHDNFGNTSWLHDLNVDGAVDRSDVETFVTEIIRTTPGDFDLNGQITGRDYLIWLSGAGATDATYLQGDANFDGTVDRNDLVVWQTGFLGGGSAAATAVPEPGTFVLWAVGIVALKIGRRMNLIGS
ncbi:MAG: hypothetical protein WD851_11375 [Pirellulales bacterium]